MEEVIEILDAYDPIQFLIGFPQGERFEGKQQRLEAQIKSDWVALKTQALQSLGVKRTFKHGKRSHPLGPCANAGLSLPLQVREAIAAKAEETGQTPSEIATEVLAGVLL